MQFEQEVAFESREQVFKISLEAMKMAFAKMNPLSNWSLLGEAMKESHTKSISTDGADGTDKKNASPAFICEICVICGKTK